MTLNECDRLDGMQRSGYAIRNQRKLLRRPKRMYGNAARLLALVAILFAPVGLRSLAQTLGCVPNGANYPCVYVASGGAETPGKISVINAATNTIIDTIALPSAANAVSGIAVTPDNKFVLVPTSDPNQIQGSNFLSVISTASNTITATNIALQGVPLQIAVSPDNSQAWIAEGPGAGSDFRGVEIFDIASQTIAGNLDAIPLQAPTSIAFSPDSQFAYVADTCTVGAATEACLEKIGTAAAHPLTTIDIAGTMGNQPSSIAVTPDGSLACMSVLDANFVLEVACLDSSNDTVVILPTTGQNATPADYGIAITPAGILYAAAPASNDGTPLSQVYIFNPAQDGYLGPFTIGVGNTGDEGSGPIGVSASADGAAVYVTDYDIDSVSIISTATDTIVATLPLPTGILPRGVAAMPSIPPSITTQPANQTVNYGQTATLTVAAGGTAPLVYQWYVGQSGDTTNPIAGATTDTYTTPAQAATTSYWVAVSNIVAGGLLDSMTAIVMVTPVAPTITTQPVSQSISTGLMATLTVTATGSPTLTYQWYQGQSGDTTTPLGGATGATFETQPLTATTSYWVQVSNLVGSVNSATATITVLAAPTVGCLPNTATYPCVYVAIQSQTLSAPSQVSVINVATNAVIGSIPLGSTTVAFNVSGIALTPDNQFVLAPSSVSNQSVNSLNIISTASNAIVGTPVALQGIPSQIAVSPDNSQAWIAESAADTGGNSINAVEIFDIATQAITGNIPLPAPTSIAFSPDSQFAYVADTCAAVGVAEACLDQISTAAHTINAIPIANTLGNEPASIAVTPDGSRACMSALDGNFMLHMACVATATATLVTPLPTTAQNAVPSNFGFAISPAGILYAAAPGFGESILSQYFIFNPALDSYIGSVTIGSGANGSGSGPTGVAVSADGATLYVTDSAIDSVSVIAPASGATVATLGLPAPLYAPQGAAAMPSIPPSITTQPVSQTINYGQPATMTVTATGTAPLTYQWYIGQSGVTTAPIAGATTNSYTTAALTATASYWVAVGNIVANGGLQSATATITVSPFTPPAIVTQPMSQTITAGQTATLSVTASGTPPLSYQWYQGVSGNTSAPIAQAINPTYTTPPLNATTSYWVLVSTQAVPGSVASATATITATPVVPVITTQPASQTIPAGQVANLSVVATGTPPLAYQWYQGASGDTSAPITGATAASYTTPLLNAAASYWVLVSNSAGTVNSVTATITVTPITPAIVTQPASQTINFNQVATLSVVAGGTGPFTYQWYQGQSGNTSSPIAGATAAIYVTPPLAAAASYWVAVSNAVGSVNSATAVISVNQSPTCTLAVQGSGSTTANFAQVFTVVATATCIDPQSSTLSTSIDWGDGSAPSVGPGGSLTASHTYPAPLQSSYTNTVTSTDALGLQGMVTYSTTLIPTSQVPGVFAGQTAYFTLPLTSQTPGPPIQVTFNCTTATDSNGNVVDASSIGLECISKPLTVILSATPQNITLGIETTGTAQASAKTHPGREVLLGCACLLLPGLLFWGGGKNKKPNSRRRRITGWGLWILLLGFVFQLNGCATGGFTPPSITPAPSSTPAVNYQVTIVDNPVDPTNTTGFVQISLIVPITISPAQ